MKQFERNESIPNFSYRSAFLIVFAAILGSFVLPYVLDSLGVSWKMLHVFLSALVTASATAISRCFIESHEGITKKFWQTFIIVFIIIGFISFFWMYDLIMI